VNWKENHRVPEVTEWIQGLTASFYPHRCRNCWRFPTVGIKVTGGWVVNGQYTNSIIRQWCPFCGAEDFCGGALWG
jgi:hypothetical protein